MNRELSRQGRGLRKLARVHPNPDPRIAPGRRPPWIAMTGAKGGVGKTLLAVNLAIMVAQRGQRTLLVDLDPGCGNVDVHLRIARHRSLDDVVAGRCSLEEALVAGPGGLAVLGGRSGSATLTDPAGIRSALDAIARFATDFDVVVFDTGAGIGPAVLAVAEHADLVLGTTTPDPSALTDAYALCKQLHLRKRPLPRLLVNRARSRDEAMRTAGHLQTVCRRFLERDCLLFAWVRADRALERSVLEQRPFAIHGQSPASQDLQALCAVTMSALPPLPRRTPVHPRPIEHSPGETYGRG